MTNSHEAFPDHADPDPHFNRLFALVGLSQAALQSVIHVLQAQEEASHTGTVPSEPKPEELLSHYIQSPDVHKEQNIHAN